MFSITADIQDDLVEPIYNHVHHGKCFFLLERARVGLLDAIGFPNDQLLREGKVLVITNVSVSYKREVKSGLVTVTCDDVRYEDRTIHIHQRIVNSRGKTAVEGDVSSMFMDINTRRGMDAPTDFLAALMKIREPIP